VYDKNNGSKDGDIIIRIIIKIIIMRSSSISSSSGSGSAIAETVSRWLPTAADRVRARVCQVGFVVDKVASGQDFSEYFGFPYQNRSFHQLHHHHHNHPGQLAESLRRADHPYKES
jgi:hypothetical protein